MGMLKTSNKAKTADSKKRIGAPDQLSPFSVDLKQRW
jgi:hypothetical protein